MIWHCYPCANWRHPYGIFRLRFNKDNNSEVNTAEPVFGTEIVNGIDSPVYHVNFIRISEKFFDSFWRHTHFNMSIDQERFIGRYLYEGNLITDSYYYDDRHWFSVPLDTYDKLLAQFYNKELNDKLDRTIEAEKILLADYLRNRQPLEEFIVKSCPTLAEFSRSI